MIRIDPILTVRRYSTMAAVETVGDCKLPALAWTEISIRLEIVAKGFTGDRAVSLRDRAADARARATRSRLAHRTLETT